jgi:hypothetical protein
MALTATFDIENRNPFNLEPVVISGSESYKLNNVEYLNIAENGHLINVFEINMNTIAARLMKPA